MQNLLEKLTKKFKENKLKMASLAMASALTMSTVGLTSCKNTNENNLNSNINNSQEYPDNSSSSNNSENSSSTGGNENSSGGNSEIDYSQFSEIMQAILNDYHYYDLISADKSYVDAGLKPIAYQNPEYNAIPYGFLEDEGFDINKIKSGNLYSKSDMYLEGNNLFIELRAEIKSSKNYLANYILKYRLTDEELNELKALFTSLSTTEKLTYYYAPFFIQELSYQREPEIISKTYVTKGSLGAFESHANTKEYLKASTMATFLGSDISDGMFGYHQYQIHQIISTNYHNSTIGEMEIGTIMLMSSGTAHEIIDSHQVMVGTKFGNYYYFDEYKQAFKDSIKKVTYLSAENCSFRHLFDDDFWEEVLNK